MASKYHYYTMIGRVYAAEGIKRHRQYGERGDWFYAKYIVTVGQGATLARRVGEEIGDQKIISIADTVLRSIQEGANGGTYRRITEKQQSALAVTLLERYENAEGIGMAIWGLTPEEIEAAEA